MNKNELKEGDIFVAGTNYNFINKQGSNFSIDENIDNKNAGFFKTNISFSYENLRKATPEQKHWLETCISADKFITFEEAMKIFIPEYIECIGNQGNTNRFTESKIYKIKSFTNAKVFSILDNNSHSTSCIMTGGLWQFKPSTKEAYDAQLKTKEIVKVKPFEILETCRKNPNRIKQVINEEGNIFMIGDIITPTIKDSPNKGKCFKIIGFRLNKAKSMICAVTDTHNPNGIGIDKIEHFVEPKVEIKEETLLEKAKRLYPVGTKFKSATTYKLFTVKNHNIASISQNICFNTEEVNESGNYYACVRSTERWAEIIEDKPKVGDKFRFKKHDRGEFTIDRIEDSNDNKIIFYNQHQTDNRNWNRVLLKNIKIIK